MRCTKCCGARTPYRDLTRAQFDELVEILCNGIESSRGRYGAYLMHDGVHGRLHARRGARMIAISNGGAIPDTALYNVILQPEGVQIATLDEHFAVDSSPGRRDSAGKYKLAHSAHRGGGAGAGGGRARRAAQRAVLVWRSAADGPIFCAMAWASCAKRSRRALPA